MTALVELRGVSKHFGDLSILRDIDLEIAAGESVAVVGPSGSGKSTLLNILGGLLPPSAGQVRFEGKDIAALSPDDLATFRNTQIGFVFQSHHLLPQCSAFENVLIPTLVTAGADKSAAAERARQLLERVGLGARADHTPARLSGGECQRVAVVRALINQPKLLLADEPTGSLDATAADELGTLLCEFNESEETTLVTVTHSEHLAARMQRTLNLGDGALVALSS